MRNMREMRSWHVVKKLKMIQNCHKTKIRLDDMTIYRKTDQTTYPEN